MPLLNLHDRQELERIVAEMGTEELAARIEEGGLSAFAREVVAEELARRVLADDVHFVSEKRKRTGWAVGDAYTTVAQLYTFFWILYFVYMAFVLAR